jgi:hypothetical protein
LLQLRDAVAQQQAGEVGAGELAAPIGVKDRGLAVSGQRRPEGAPGSGLTPQIAIG